MATKSNKTTTSTTDTRAQLESALADATKGHDAATAEVASTTAAFASADEAFNATETPDAWEKRQKADDARKRAEAIQTKRARKLAEARAALDVHIAAEQRAQLEADYEKAIEATADEHWQRDAHAVAQSAIDLDKAAAAHRAKSFRCEADHAARIDTVYAIGAKLGLDPETVKARLRDGREPMYGFVHAARRQYQLVNERRNDGEIGLYVREARAAIERASAEQVTQ
jgi:hypothetical protein